MLAIHSETVRTGVCGFCLPQAELFRRFKLMEVQQTFYWPPQLKTVQRWRQAAPEDFEFTLKAFQAITHPYNYRTYRKTKFSNDELKQCGNFRDTPVIRAAWDLTKRLAEGLGATIVVFQCPPSFAATEENLRQLRGFFGWAGRGNLRFAWEPRHESWTGDLVADVCGYLDLIHAVDPFEQESAYGHPRYYRVHGRSLGGFHYDYDHPYSDDELTSLWHQCETEPTYCMFNNKQMAADAERFGEVGEAVEYSELRHHA